MSATPKISCLIGVYNAERYLEEAVSSILAQTFSDFELIIIDDGSTDRTPEILAKFGARDPRTKIVRQTNGGLARALNAAAAIARGELLARMDADDVAEPDRFDKQAAYMADHLECVVVGSALLLIDPDGDVLGEQVPPTSDAAIRSELLAGNGVLPHPSTMIRATAFRHAGGYREQFAAAQDLDLWLRLAEIGTLANLPEPLLRYRLHDESVTTQKRQVQLACAERAVREARERLGLPGADQFQIASGRVPTRARTLRGWARMALKSRHVTVARKHAWSAFCHRPLQPSHWFLLLRSLAHSAGTAYSSRRP